MRRPNAPLIPIAAAALIAAALLTFMCFRAGAAGTGKLLTESTTYVEGSLNRLNNIKLASKAIDKTVVRPGEVFSFNQTVGERTRVKGYKIAGAFSGKKTVKMVGGGVCQVSSTIFDALLRTDIKILERAPHSKRVSYLPEGHDATVKWGATDFKFKNNTAQPLIIRADVSKDRHLTIRIYTS